MYLYLKLRHNFTSGQEKCVVHSYKT